MPDSANTPSDSEVASPYNYRAFPSTAINSAYGGMSLRDWFAGQVANQAMARGIELDRQGLAMKRAAEIAFEFADAMILQSQDAPDLGLIYTERDYDRARQALAGEILVDDDEAIRSAVHAVAEALGMRRAGA